MKCLIAAEYGESLAQTENPAELGEVVLPALPLGDCNHFVGVASLGRANYARIQEVTAFDPDVALENLMVQLPGIPKALHEDNIIATIKAANNLPDTFTYRVFVDAESARVQAVEDEGLIHHLWRDRPASKYL